MIFAHPDFDDHARITFFHDPETHLQLINAQHRLVSGRCAGGIRFRSYPSESDALTDALRLSRAMTRKFALASLPVGGGKTVVIGDPSRLKSPALLQSVGSFVHSLGGQYFGGPDVGMGASDIQVIGDVTPYVGGKAKDTSTPTAIGTFKAIQAVAHFLFGAPSLAGKSVAVQGVGAVGRHLCVLLKSADARIVVADVDRAAAASVAQEVGAEIVAPDEILRCGVDILAPCALGGILHSITIAQLQARAVCGCANNQLATTEDGRRLHERGIPFVPDFVASAGGAISGALEIGLIDQTGYEQRLDGIYATTLAVLSQANDRGLPPNEIAEWLADRAARSGESEHPVAAAAPSVASSSASDAVT
jgi:leucine dehydrogenase